MSVLIFILVLAVLIIVHELGHFFAARSAGVRVDEFGVGFPPRAASLKPRGSETRYSLNWIPLGGFVKIFGEDAAEAEPSGPDWKRSFVAQAKLTQIGILVAGVLGNLLAAWLFLSVGLAIGSPVSVTDENHSYATDVRTEVLSVLPGSPAAEAGLSVGDRLTMLSRGSATRDIGRADDVRDFVGDDVAPVTVVFERDGARETLVITPSRELTEGGAALGVVIDTVGIVTLPLHRALIEGAEVTTKLTAAVAVGLWHLALDALSGNADLSYVTGPVGLVTLVGEAGALGFSYLLSFTAFISINLAVINLVPFPALDGGRILFVLIEALKGSPIRPKVAGALNTAGFALLILLMLVVTYHDIVRLISS